VFSRNNYCGILSVTYSIETRIFGSRNCLYSYFTIVTGNVRIFVLNRSAQLRYRDNAVPSSTINFDNHRQIAKQRPFGKVSQLNNQQITQALNDYGVLNEVIES